MRFVDKDPKRYEDMTDLEKAKADMDYARRFGGFRYKQARRHYQRLARKAKVNANTTLC